VIGPSLRAIQLVCVIALVVVAIVVTAGRLILPRADQFSTSIAAYLSDTISANVEFDSFQGRWAGFQPGISISGVQVELDGDKGVALDIRSMHLQLNILQSLYKRDLVFTSLTIDGIELNLTQSTDGSWLPEEFRNLDTRGSLSSYFQRLMQHHHLGFVNTTLHFCGLEHQKSVIIPQLKFDTMGSISSGAGLLTLSDQQDQVIEFAFNAQRGGKKNNGFEASGYLNFDLMQVGDWLQIFEIGTPIELDINRLHLGGQVWFGWDELGISTLRGSFQAPEIDLVPLGQKIDPFYDVSAKLDWTRDNLEGRKEWQLLLEDFTFKWQGKTFEPRQQIWKLQSYETGQLLSVYADQIDLEVTTYALLATDLLPLKAKDALSSMKPKGKVLNWFAQYPLLPKQNESSLPNFQIEANLVDAGIDAWRNVPAMSGVDGYLNFSPTQGKLIFSSENVALHLSKLFSKTWWFDQAKGAISWSITGKNYWVRGDRIQAAGYEGSVNAKFSAFWPADVLEPRIDLLVGINDLDVFKGRDFIPDVKLSADISAWLDRALVGGEVDKAGYIYAGIMGKSEYKSANKSLLSLIANKATLKFHKDWPALNNIGAMVSVDGLNAEVVAESAQYLGSNLSETVAIWEKTSRENVVKLNSKIEGPLADILASLRDTPVRGKLVDIVDEMTVSGEAITNLTLMCPVTDFAATKVDARVITDNGELNLNKLGLSLTDIKGEFTYSSKKGLNASSIDLKLFDEDLRVNAVSSPVDVDGDLLIVTKFAGDGTISVHELANWLPQITILSHLNGTADYQAVLQLGGGAPAKLDISSDLLGIQVDLPEPFAKPSNGTGNFAFTALLSDSQVHYLSYKDLFKYRLNYSDGSYGSGEITLGGKEPTHQVLEGVRVTASLPEIKIDEWIRLYENLEEEIDESQSPSHPSEIQLAVGVNKTTSSNTLATGGTSFFSVIKQIEINTNELRYEQRQLGDFQLFATRVDEAWRLEVEGLLAKGSITQIGATDEPVSIELDYLRLPESNSDSDPLSSITPQSLPQMKFNAEQFSVGNNQYGLLKFDLQPRKIGAVAKMFQMGNDSMNLVGELMWNYRSGIHSGAFEGQFTSDDIGQALENLNIERSIEGKSVEMIGSLDWPGSPGNFALSRSTGEMGLAAKDGQFLQLESAAGLMRLFGVLNFSSLTRRLQLDFSDLFEEGVAFDKIEGKFSLADGVMQIDEPVIINGPSAKFVIEGEVDIPNEQYNQEVVVILPFMDNLPLATVIAGVPQVGVPLWLLNKAFGNMFDEFTTMRYRVVGPWSKPEFERVTSFTSVEMPPDGGTSESTEPGPVAERDKPVNREAQ